MIVRAVDAISMHNVVGARLIHATLNKNIVSSIFIQ